MDFCCTVLTRDCLGRAVPRVCVRSKAVTVCVKCPQGTRGPQGMCQVRFDCAFVSVEFLDGTFDLPIVCHFDRVLV